MIAALVIRNSQKENTSVPQPGNATEEKISDSSSHQGAKTRAITGELHEERLEVTLHYVPARYAEYTVSDVQVYESLQQFLNAIAAHQ
ncbi:hypothetical protein R1flu_014935 [Riccia fluitans]|uniref:Uncharacterized protein n=1 Tax=Riccia fluitans TaxID=41844 RepID=A0ABD1YKU8_9MARC